MRQTERSMELCGGMLGVPGLTTAEPVETLESVLKSYIAGKVDQGRKHAGSGQAQAERMFSLSAGQTSGGPWRTHSDRQQQKKRSLCMSGACIRRLTVRAEQPLV